MTWRAPVGFLLAFVVLAALAVLGDDIGFSSFYIVLLTTILFWTAQATSWNILSGYSGYFSFGQAAYVGVGAYTAAVLVARHGLNYFVTIPIAGMLGAILALIIGALAFRLRSLRGEIFALLTLAVPFILATLATTSRSIDGGQGITVPIPAYPSLLGSFQNLLYLLELVVATAAVGCAYAIHHSRAGWALTSIREAEEVSETVGVATFRYKMLALVASGLIGAASGSLFALQIGFVNVNSVFNLTIPLYVIVMSVLGGRTHWLGPVIGAVLIGVLQDRLSASGLSAWSPIFLGAILAVLVVVAPDGLQARLRVRPLRALGALVVVVGVLAVVRVWGGPLDWITLGMFGAAAVAIWPGSPRRAPRGQVRDAAHPATADEARGSTPVQRTAANVQRTAANPVTVGSDGRGPVILDCVGVSKYFGGVRALDELTLAIREGELVGLVGPNGSGKTTLVNLLSGAMEATGGVIRIDGRDIGDMPPHRIAHLGVARTYQVPRPFTAMTVRDNVAMAIMFGRTPCSLSEARHAAEKRLDFVQLGHLGDARPTALNLHQRQLLEMARALATDPKVLLLDEALAGLNPAEIDNAVRVVRRIHRSGVTIVFVEHVLRVLNQLATRIVVLDMGALLADGEPHAVMNDPAVVRAYLGRHAGA